MVLFRYDGDCGFSEAGTTAHHGATWACLQLALNCLSVLRETLVCFVLSKDLALYCLPVASRHKDLWPGPVIALLGHPTPSPKLLLSFYTS